MTQLASQLSSDRYRPGENEPYMSDAQVAYFKERLMRRKAELRRKISKAIQKIKSLEAVQADILASCVISCICLHDGFLKNTGGDFSGQGLTEYYKGIRMTIVKCPVPGTTYRAQVF